MARLASEPTSGSGDNNAANDAARMHYMRQNRDIAKANSALTVRIRALEQENTRILSENLTLAEENLRLRVHLERRDKAAEFLDGIAGTKQRLQDGVNMLNDLLKELAPSGYSSTRERHSPQLPRHRRASRRSSEVPEGFLPAITEDRRRSSSGDVIAPRRGSLNFDDIQLLQPTPQLYVDSDEDSDDSPPACMIDTRPRRRRDSANILHPSSPDSSPKPSKRKFTSQETSPTLSSPELDFKFSKVSERAANAARRQMEAEKARTPTKRRERSSDDEAKGEGPRSSPSERPAKASRTATGDSVRSSSISTTSSTISSTSASRRALGPKSTNMDPLNSPVKQAAAANGYTKPPSEKPEKPAVDALPVPRGRNKDTPPPESEPPASGRTARRARSAINYAEPSLRVKMRREDPKPMDAVKGEGKTRRSISASATPEPRPAKIKLENSPGDEDWLSTLPPAKEEPVKRVTKVSFDPEEQEIPEPVISSRRRRTSGFVAPVPGMQDEGREDNATAKTRRNSIAVDDVKRVKPTRSFSAEGAGIERKKSTKEMDEKATRRRSMML